MPDCNIRNIDDALMKSMKVRAIERGWTLREWCIAAFEHTLACCPPVADLDEPPCTTAGEAKYSVRTAHAIGCTCFICKPPKEKP